MLFLIRIGLILFAVYWAWQTGRRLLGFTQPPRFVRRPPDQPIIRVQETAQCPVCQTYLPPDSRGCARADCPRRG